MFVILCVVSLQAQELSNFINLLFDYVDPNCHLFTRIYEEGSKIVAESAIMQEIGQDDLETMTEDDESDDSDSEPSVGTSKRRPSKQYDDQSDDYKRRASKVIERDQRRPSEDMHSGSFPVKKKNSNHSRHSGSTYNTSNYVASISYRATKRRSILSSNEPCSYSILPPGVQNMQMSYDISHHFMTSDACKYIEVLLDGDEGLELKGLKYWKEQLKLLDKSVEKVKEDIKISLEDKRNFFSFILTVVTVVLAPLTILTSYW
jgi:hypothetical protein